MIATRDTESLSMTDSLLPVLTRKHEANKCSSTASIANLDRSAIVREGKHNLGLLAANHLQQMTASKWCRTPHTTRRSIQPNSTESYMNKAHTFHESQVTDVQSSPICRDLANRTPSPVVPRRIKNHETKSG